VPVQEFLSHHPDFVQLKQNIFAFIHYWIPKYQIDGRSYLTVGIGCTGGQHRSVAMVNELYEQCLHHADDMFKKITLLKRHRELNKISLTAI
jgi:UPF0042 nucleotide-binding protein